jgi:hypothetical protein
MEKKANSTISIYGATLYLFKIRKEMRLRPFFLTLPVQRSCMFLNPMFDTTSATPA